MLQLNLLLTFHKSAAFAEVCVLSDGHTDRTKKTYKRGALLEILAFQRFGFALVRYFLRFFFLFFGWRPQICCSSTCSSSPTSRTPYSAADVPGITGQYAVTNGGIFALCYFFVFRFFKIYIQFLSFFALLMRFSSSTCFSPFIGPPPFFADVRVLSDTDELQGKNAITNGGIFGFFLDILSFRRF